MPVFSVGEKVYARWPRTTDWYPATVTDTVDASHVNVIFADGTDLDDLPIKHIKVSRGLAKTTSALIFLLLWI